MAARLFSIQFAHTMNSLHYFQYLWQDIRPAPLILSGKELEVWLSVFLGSKYNLNTLKIWLIKLLQLCNTLIGNFKLVS
jgi:hypothetical protein